MAKFNFGVVRPYMTAEQRMINQYANEYEGTLPMLSRPHIKLSHYDTKTVASVAMRGLSLNGWTCQQTYKWWQDYRRYYSQLYPGSCCPDVLCGPKVFQRVWNTLAEWLPYHLPKITNSRWYYMNITDWDGRRRKWYFDRPDDATAVHYFLHHKNSDHDINEYHSLYSVTWDGQNFVNPKRLSVSHKAA